MKKIIFLLLAGLSAAPLVLSQQMGMYSSFSFDENNRQAHLYGATTSDYNTAYYYDIYIGLSLQLDNGQTACTDRFGWEFNYPTVERSCDYAVPMGVIRMDFITTHYLNATFRYSQLVYCMYGCTGWGDQYGFSMTSTGSGVNSDNQLIYPPGQIVEVQYQAAKAGNILRTKYGSCSVPTGETTVKEGWGNIAYDEDYATLFKARLQGTGVFDNRYVYEDLYWAYPYSSTFPTMHSDGCWFSGSVYQPAFPNENSWTVGYVQGPTNYYPESRSYGYDALGLQRSRLIYYQNRLRSTGAGACEIRYVQQMSISCNTGTFNDMRWFKNNNMKITLGQYSVTNERDNVSDSKFIP